MTDIRITLTAQRKITAIETDEFRVKLNGRTNAEYKDMLKGMGIVLVFLENNEHTSAEPDRAISEAANISNQ
jgi:hypothetical protein